MPRMVRGFFINGKGNMIFSWLKKVARFSALIGVAALPLSAADAAVVDRYAPVYAQPVKASSLKDPLSTIIAFPFEVLRWPVDQGAIFTEKYALAEKTKWFYTYLTDHGIHPDFGNVPGTGLQGGLRLDLPRLTDLKSTYPDFLWDVWTYYGANVYFQSGTKFGIEKIAGTDFFSNATFQYEDRFQDNFFGIGPDTSRGDGTTYKIQTTKLNLETGYEFSPSLHAAAYLTHSLNVIGEGEDHRKGQIGRFGTLAGNHGDKILTLGAKLEHNTRDYEDVPTKGGYQKFDFSYNEGIDSSIARYLTYRAEAAHFLRAGSTRRIFAIRGLMEHHDEVNGGTIPFYNLSKLGGYGGFSSFSETLRGYDTNRFFGETALLFNFEYRYTIWEHKGLQLDSVPFFDFGQTFNEFSRFQFRDFRTSYGAELRLSIAKHNIFNVSVAHGDEGTWLYLCSKKAF